MPGRQTVLATGEIYHIFNRGIASQPTFLDKRDYQRALASIFYYQNIEPPVRYSKFLTIPQEDREKLLAELRNKHKFLIEIIAYCLMPNHFHLLVRQTQENGISTFTSNFTNSYTRYFNTKQERKGPIYEGKFNAVRIVSDQQLIHVHRYIHLNPYSSYVVKDLSVLESYPYSSLPEYIGKTKNELCQKEIILANFRDPTSYKKFVFYQADYQRNLDQIKHVVFDK